MLLPGGWDGLNNFVTHEISRGRNISEFCDTKFETFRYNLWLHDLYQMGSSYLMPLYLGILSPYCGSFNVSIGLNAASCAGP